MTRIDQSLIEAILHGLYETFDGSHPAWQAEQRAKLGVIIRQHEQSQACAEIAAALPTEPTHKPEQPYDSIIKYVNTEGDAATRKDEAAQALESSPTSDVDEDVLLKTLERLLERPQHPSNAAYGVLRAIRPYLRTPEPGSCDDEGCPHYNTPHSHGKSSDQPVDCAKAIEAFESAFEWMCPEDAGKYFYEAWERYGDAVRAALSAPKRVDEQAIKAELTAISSANAGDTMISAMMRVIHHYLDKARKDGAWDANQRQRESITADELAPHIRDAILKEGWNGVWIAKKLLENFDIRKRAFTLKEREYVALTEQDEKDATGIMAAAAYAQVTPYNRADMAEALSALQRAGFDIRRRGSDDLSKEGDGS